MDWRSKLIAGNLDHTGRVAVRLDDGHFLGGLKQIPNDLYEASGVDGFMKYSASGSTEGFTVTPTYANASKMTLSNLIVEDSGMKFNLTWPNVTFTDKASSETISY